METEIARLVKEALRRAFVGPLHRQRMANARGKGAIVNIAPIVAVAPELLNGVYGAAKHVQHLTGETL
jgi:short-subunit dehydrogenase